ncbi:HD domain-containing protein [Allokutzneria oryzae]|uniref:HD domain-containing protein n=1 Tax=Allokutzneria oryzae TaxID=1378989 RepID=A0ABV5ZXE8_9PSEU
MAIQVIHHHGGRKSVENVLPQVRDRGGSRRHSPHVPGSPHGHPGVGRHLQQVHHPEVGHLERCHVPVAGTSIRSAVDEYEAAETTEARRIREADKLEMLLQAVEYREIGVQRVQGWIDSALKGLTTATAQRVADTLSPLAWRDR